MAEEIRPKRLCDVCSKLDDHPRHVQAVPVGTEGVVPNDAFLDGLPDGVPARAIAELMDPTTVVRHMDCCASRGCNICMEVLDVAKAAHGAALTKALTSGVADKLGTSTNVAVIKNTEV